MDEKSDGYSEDQKGLGSINVIPQNIVANRRKVFSGLNNLNTLSTFKNLKEQKDTSLKSNEIETNKDQNKTFDFCKEIKKNKKYFFQPIKDELKNIRDKKLTENKEEGEKETQEEENGALRSRKDIFGEIRRRHKSSVSKYFDFDKLCFNINVK